MNQTLSLTGNTGIRSQGAEEKPQSGESEAVSIRIPFIRMQLPIRYCMKR